MQTFTTRALAVLATLAVGTLGGSTPLAAQTVREQLSTLLTTAGPVDLPAADPAAAARSDATLLGLFGVELATAPLATGTSGFVYRFNREIGVLERSSDSFGAFFTERVLRTGEGQLSLGVVIQSAAFTSLQGLTLDEGTFPVNASRAAGAATPFAVDALQLELSSRTLTTKATYGVSDDLDVGVALPFVQTSFSGIRVTNIDAQPRFSIAGNGRASGIGDVALTGRLRLTGRRGSGLAFGSDLRLPTGSATNLLGSGRLAYRGQVIGSLERGRLELSGNAGAGIGGASDEIFWSGAMTWAASPRVTIVSELMGRRLADLHRYNQVYQPHSQVGGVETMRWLADESTALHVGYALGGVKWNVADTMLVGAHLLVRLSESGLRARVAPSLTLEYDFAP